MKNIRSLVKLLMSLCLLLILNTSCNIASEDCATSDSPFQQPINPNGDSELSLLMRAMFEDAERMKEQIAKGIPVKVSENHKDILKAHATEPEKVSTDEYHTFADVYLKSLESLQSADINDRESEYKNMVGSCIACHRSVCPGPIVRIKKLL